MGKRIGAVFAGLLSGMLVIMVIEMASSMVYPMPEGLDPEDAEAMTAFVASLPIGAFLFVLLAYAMGSFAGGFVAGKIGGSFVPPVIVAALLEIGAAINLLQIVHPTWFMVVSLMICLPGALIGGRLALGPFQETEN